MVQQQHNTLNPQTRCIELAGEHSRICWFLSDFFLQCPDQTLLATLQQHLATQQQQFTLQPDSELAGLWRVLQQGGDDKLIQRLAVEYTRLFAGLHRDLVLPPPFESLHRGDNLMGEINLSVMDRYRQAGYGIIEADAGPQDHIGVELRFMALLFYDEFESLNQGDSDKVAEIRQHQHLFLNEHLLQWVPEYCQRVKKETREEFYVHVAMITKQTLEKMDYKTASN